MRRGERTAESVSDVLWPCFPIPSHLFWALSKASLVAPWHGLTSRQTSSMLRGHLIWCLIHTAPWHLKTRVSLCGCGVSPEGSGGPVAVTQAGTWRAIAITPPPGGFGHTAALLIHSRKFSGEKSVMRHVSRSSVRVLATGFLPQSHKRAVHDFTGVGLAAVLGKNGTFLR